MTRWASLELASQAEGEREPPTSQNDWLGLASQVEGEREPPTSQNDLLGVVGAGVAGGNSPGELLAVLL